MRTAARAGAGWTAQGGARRSDARRFSLRQRNRLRGAQPDMAARPRGAGVHWPCGAGRPGSQGEQCGAPM
eukprot:2627331-Lingulodinium_polyedra.AAC.1